LLVRPKSGTDVTERIKELINCRVFDELRRQEPLSLKKLQAVSGDITSDGLGLSPSDLQLLTDNVSIIFHSAATLKFNEELRKAVEINIKGTKRVLDMAHKCRNLDAFIYVSTAYANCDKAEVSERIYTPNVDPRQLISMIDWMEPDILQSITPKLIGKMPNTYAYTKGLTEYMLQEECGSIPLAIVRPSIVTAAFKEPIPGWVDNLNGPTGFIAGTSKGVLRAMRLGLTSVGDIIPVDFPIAMMISAAWFTATHRPNNIMVYNCTSGQLNPLTWGQIHDNLMKSIYKFPSSDMMWYPTTAVNSDLTLHRLDAFIYHTVPAKLLDIAARLTGRRPRMARLYQKVESATSAMEFFSTRGWNFSHANAEHLQSKMSREDRASFFFDVRAVDWNSYLENYVIGVRHFVMKEDPASLPLARRQLVKMYWLRVILRLLAFVTLLQGFRKVLSVLAANKLPLMARVPASGFLVSH